jgi:hypothetical protein
MVGQRIGTGLFRRHVRRRAKATPNVVRFDPSAFVEADRAFATPKSVTIADPPDRSTLSGLMSR